VRGGNAVGVLLRCRDDVHRIGRSTVQAALLAIGYEGCKGRIDHTQWDRPGGPGRFSVGGDRGQRRAHVRSDRAGAEFGDVRRAQVHRFAAPAHDEGLSGIDHIAHHAMRDTALGGVSQFLGAGKDRRAFLRPVDAFGGGAIGQKLAAAHARESGAPWVGLGFTMGKPSRRITIYSRLRLVGVP
jgi:hypothetical protein